VGIIVGMLHVLQLRRTRALQLIIVGDFMIFINHMVFNSLPKGPLLCILVLHSKKPLEGFIEIHFYHWLWGLNHQAYAMVNKACAWPFQKNLKMAGGEEFSNIPSFFYPLVMKCTHSRQRTWGIWLWGWSSMKHIHSWVG
jgi:hypothetical protein